MIWSSLDIGQRPEQFYWHPTMVSITKAQMVFEDSQFEKLSFENQRNSLKFEWPDNLNALSYRLVLNFILNLAYYVHLIISSNSCLEPGD